MARPARLCSMPVDDLVLTGQDERAHTRVFVSGGVRQ
jgi:hypothetical protein